jgi:hypothetical protein
MQLVAHTGYTPSIMQLVIAAMNTALRVRMALDHQTHPLPADVAELRVFAPLLADAPLHELACELIRQSLKSIEEARQSGTTVVIGARRPDMASPKRHLT